MAHPKTFPGTNQPIPVPKQTSPLHNTVTVHDMFMALLAPNFYRQDDPVSSILCPDCGKILIDDTCPDLLIFHAQDPEDNPAPPTVWCVTCNAFHAVSELKADCQTGEMGK